MLAYRICRAPYRALDGEGARRYGGRWTEPGHAVVYAASSAALAALEALVHMDPVEVPDDLMLLTIQLPDDIALSAIDLVDLPADWAKVPEHPACVAAGTAWAAAGTTVGCRVPSAPVPEERNLLLNPAHSDMSRVRVVRERPFVFDPRLLP